MQSGALVDSSYGDSIRKALGLGFPPRGPERQGEGPRGAGLAAGGPKGGRAFVRLEPDAAVEFGRSSQQRPTRAISGKGGERGEKKKKMTTSEFSF